MSYVRLKHTLAEIALGALERPDSAVIANVLLAYARRSRAQPSVSLAALGRATDLTPEEVNRALLRTGLFDGSGDRARIALAAPFRPVTPYLRRQVARVAVAIRLLESSRPAGIPEEIWRAAALFNAGLFFECHEYLEDVWRAAAPPERSFYHGLVQAAAGCYHLEKGNVHGARTLLQKAVAKLEPYAPAHRGVDVAALLAGVRRVLARLERMPPSLPASRRALPVFPLGGRREPSPRSGMWG